MIVGLSGASGTIYGIRLLEVLRDVEGVETHLVFSNAAKRTALLETDYDIKQIETLADNVYGFTDIAASISSGSFKTAGMVVISCSIKTLAGITQGMPDSDYTRAATNWLAAYRDGEDAAVACAEVADIFGDNDDLWQITDHYGYNHPALAAEQICYVP